MAITKFVFEETEEKDETTDIQLCANRWKLYYALNEVNNLIYGLNNGKTYEEVYLHHKVYGKNEFGRDVVTEYSRNGDEGDKYTGFVPIDYIVNRLSEALEDVKHLLD